MGKATRRTFLGTGLAAAAATALPHRRVLGANDDVRIVVVGVGSNIKIGGKGRKDAEDFRKVKGARVVGLCDCDETNLARGVADAEKAGDKVKTYRDVRAVLDDPEVDAISITAPNHWHALMAIWASQAGKDAFVQKPGSHNLFEGRKMVEAAHKYKRIVMVTHGPRTSPTFGEAFDFARSGGLGKPRIVRGLNYRPRESIGKVPGPQPIPEGCDYNLWCGPAPMVPLLREYLHYDWHWIWDTGNGDIGNMGIHNLDGCRWAAGQNQFPKHAISVGGRFGYADDGQTPNSLLTFYDYDPIPILFEVRGLPKGKEHLLETWGGNQMDTYLGQRIGVFVECDDGYVFEDKAYDKKGNTVKVFEGPGVDDKQNFVDAVRSRREEDLIATVEGGHLSAALIHLANISYRLGVARPEGESRERIAGMADAKESFDRFLAHLDANGVDLAKTPPVLGAMLSLNPDEETFRGELAQEAAALATRDYRAPFVVPQQV